MADQDEQQMYQDLKGFMLSTRMDLRLAATEAVLQHLVVSGDGSDGTTSSVRDKLIKHGIIPALVQNVLITGDDDHDVSASINALQALVYLSSVDLTNATSIEEILQAGTIPRLMEIVLSSPPTANNNINHNNNSNTTLPWRKQVNYAMALLANLTRSEVGAVQMVGQTLPEEAISSKDWESSQEEGEKKKKKGGGGQLIRPTMELLLARFLNEQYIDMTNENYRVLLDKSVGTAAKYHDDFDDVGERGMGDRGTASALLDNHPGDPYQHFASVLMNCTQVEAGLYFLLRLHRSHKDDVGTAALQRIIPLLKTSRNPIRRRGIAGTIRNCCHDADSSWWLINVVKITRSILYPLAGPEELTINEKRGLDPDLWLEGPDKVREPDHLTRLHLADALLALCQSGKKSRHELLRDRVPVVLKWAGMVEEYEDVTDKISACLTYLEQDADDDNDDNTRAPATNFAEREWPGQATSVATGAHDEKVDDDYANVD